LGLRRSEAMSRCREGQWPRIGPAAYTGPSRLKRSRPGAREPVDSRLRSRASLAEASAQLPMRPRQTSNPLSSKPAGEFDSRQPPQRCDLRKRASKWNSVKNPSPGERAPDYAAEAAHLGCQDERRSAAGTRPITAEPSRRATAPFGERAEQPGSFWFLRITRGPPSCCTSATAPTELGLRRSSVIAALLVLEDEQLARLALRPVAE
jgi:hypothetical protein